MDTMVGEGVSVPEVWGYELFSEDPHLEPSQ